MKEAYLHLLQLLSGVKNIRWIDLDKGQIDFYETRPSISFPAILVKMDMPSIRTVGLNLQQATLRISLRVAFDFAALQSSGMASPEARRQSLEYFDTMERIFLAVQTKTNTGFAFKRTALREETREDGLKVSTIDFECDIKVKID